MFNLLRYFTISSLIACIAASLILGLFYRRTAESDLVTLAESKNVALFQSVANSLWSQIDPLVTAAPLTEAANNMTQQGVIPRLRDTVTAQLRGSQIDKIRVYNLTGITVFSTETAEIGQDSSGNAGFQQALRGQLNSELIARGPLDVFENRVETGDMLDTYLPIYDSQQKTAPIAIVEVYSDVTALVDKINATQRRVVISLLLAFALLYGVLWLIVSYANHILQRQYSQVAQTELALLQEKIVLEQRVAERTMALRDANLQLERELYARKVAQEKQYSYGERLQALRQIEQEILAVKSPETIAEVALRHLRNLIPCRLASMIVFDYEKCEGIVLAVNSDNESRVLYPNSRIPFHSFRILEGFLQVNQETKTPPAYEMTAEWRLRRNGVVKYIQVPLITHDELIGTLDLGIGADEELQPEHMEIAREAANSLAVSLQQAQLHGQISYQAQALQSRVEELNVAKLALEHEQASLAQRVEERTTELRQANEALAKASRLKDEFLASMSHELRTPLHAILSYAELLQEEIYGPINERQQRSLHDLEEVGRHLLALINDLLDVSRIEADKLDLEIGEVKVAEICEASLRFIQQSASQKNLQIITQIDERLGTMEADERRLKQILTNLLNNAVKFTPTGGQIGLDVRLRERNAQVKFVIWDCGIGIDAENLEKIFQPFVQIDARLARNYPGAGLGLALVDRLTKLHGGTVTVTSEVGKGSRFTVLLPLRQAAKPSAPEVTTPLARLDENKPAQAPIVDRATAPEKQTKLAAELPVEEPRPKSSANGQAYRAPSYTPIPVTGHEPPLVKALLNQPKPLLLVCEDNELNRKTLVDFLEFKGYDVVVAGDGQQAIDVAAEYDPDLILIDVQMPVLDGLSAIRQMRAKGNTKPIIALTGLAMHGDEQRCISAGATAYYSKPVRLNELIAVVDRQLRNRLPSKDNNGGASPSVVVSGNRL
ncbi:MAG: ATP-binding protein [Caldilineaceae bacterium]